MSLDDLIKKNGTGKGGGRGKGKGRGGRGRGAGRANAKATPKPVSVIQKPKGTLASAMSTKTQPVKVGGGLTTGAASDPEWASAQGRRALRGTCRVQAQS